MPRKLIKTEEIAVEKPLFNKLPQKYQTNDYHDTLDVFQKEFGKIPINSQQKPIFYDKMNISGESDNYIEKSTEIISKKPIFIDKINNSRNFDETPDKISKKPFNCYSVDLLGNKVKDFNEKDLFRRGKGLKYMFETPETCNSMRIEKKSNGNEIKDQKGFDFYTNLKNLSQKTQENEKKEIIMGFPRYMPKER